MKRIPDFIIFAIGLAFLTSLLHELYHFSICGGSFLAGVWFTQGKIYVADTWCKVRNGGGGEIIPTSTEIVFLIAGIVYKLNLMGKKITIKAGQIFVKHQIKVLKRKTNKNKTFAVNFNYLKSFLINVHNLLFTELV